MSANGTTELGMGRRIFGRRQKDLSFVIPNELRTNHIETTLDADDQRTDAAGKETNVRIGQEEDLTPGFGGAGIESGSVTAIGPFEQLVNADGLYSGELVSVLRVFDRNHLWYDTSRSRLTTKALDALGEHS